MELHVIPNVRSEYSEQKFKPMGKVLPGNNSLNLIWFIHKIEFRPFLQNVYKRKRKSETLSGFFMPTLVLAQKYRHKKKNERCALKALHPLQVRQSLRSKVGNPAFNGNPRYSEF